jgi:peptidoglycan hydrolase-like protein with peptidoglycan-binding domain
MFDDERSLADELLAVGSEHELDRFLGAFLDRVGRANGLPLGSARGRALGGILKTVARQELAGLAGGSGEVGQELEEVEGFLRFAARAARRAGRIPRPVRPRAAARLAVTRAARSRRPKRRRPRHPGPGARRSTPVRHRPLPQPLPRWRDIRWVQAALNRILGLRLAVDGIVGPQTRSAIRSFQSKYGLVVDGIVGPQTGAALEAALRGAPPASVPTAPRAPAPRIPAPSTPGGPRVDIAAGAVVSDKAVRVLEEILDRAGLDYAKITSGFRGPEHQARVMYDLVRGKGVTYAKSLYGSAGDRVIDVYAAGERSGWSAEEIQQAMARKIVEVGPTNVSRHGSIEYDVIDVGPNSSNYGDAENRALHRAAQEAVQSGLIDKYLGPLTSPRDPAHHIEIKKRATQGELLQRALRAPALAPHAYRGPDRLGATRCRCER